MENYFKASKLLTTFTLILLSSGLLVACGGTSGEKVKSSSHPEAFKWTDAGVSNNYLPLGNIVDRTPTFTWPDYTDAGLRATEYNFGHENTIGGVWKEYTVSASAAGCIAGSTCSYTPTNHTFSIGDQKAWWVRGKINGRWKEWSSAHVFKVVTTQPPTGGAYQPVGVTPTVNPVFKWPRIGSNSNYQIGIETQVATGWKTFNASCTTSVCSSMPNYGFSVGDRMTWWVRPVGGAWSDRNDFTITNTGGIDTQAPTVPTNLIEVSVTANTASLAWSASTDNIAVTGYRIYRNAQQVGTSTSTSFTDTSLQSSTNYTYTVRAFDATNNVSDVSNSVVVTTESGSTAGDVINKRVSTGSDDAEEFASGGMYLNSSDLELTYSSSSQKVGIRFSGLSIPKNAIINRAYIQFTVDETSSSNVPLTIQADASDNASTFTGSARNISSRAKTASSVSWSPTAWSTVGQAGTSQQTPDLKSIVQEITSRTGWNSGNAIAFLITSTSNGKRVAEAFEGDPSAAPLLHIEYTAGGGGGNDTQAPTSPSNLEKNKVKAESVSMKWLAATDNVAVTGYNVYRDGTLLETVTKLKYKDVTVTPNTTYTYTVKAVDAANNHSTASNVLRVTTLSLGVSDITEPAGIYNTDLDVTEMKVKVLPPVGSTCEIDNYDGCTFGAVLQDINSDDEFKPEVAIEFTTVNGFSAVGTMRQRGAVSRKYPVKSFRVKLDKNGPAWNGEHRLQFVKAYSDLTRMRHRVNYDLISEIDNLPSMRVRYVHLTVEDKGNFTFEETPIYNILSDYQETDLGIFLQVEYFGKEYLERRNWIADSRVYKIESFKFEWEPAAFELDADGKPVDKVAFEERVEIKSGKDHRAFVEMLQAVNDATNDFDSDVIATYFDRDNYLNWLAVNLLSNNWDTRTHNYYLYNPKGTKKFYFVPWDYDNTFKANINPATGENIIAPHWYTHAIYWRYTLHQRFFQTAANVSALKQKVIVLRQTSYSDDSIREKLAAYRSLVEPFIQRTPDNIWRYRRLATDAERSALFNQFVDEIITNASMIHSNFLTYFDSPMGFRINTARQQNGDLKVDWSDSVSLQGNNISYDLQISTTKVFAAGDIVKTVTGLTDSIYNESLNLVSGTYYVKVIARDITDPQNLWQLPVNQLKVATPGQATYRVFGVREFIIQ